MAAAVRIMLAIKAQLAPVSMTVGGIILVITGYALMQVTVSYTEEQRKVIAERMKEEGHILGSCPREGCQPPSYYNPYVSLGQALIGFGLVLAVAGGILLAAMGRQAAN
ncbi:MAG: hypothetical protein C4292_03535 [Nitrososphaera sp.]